MLGPAIAIVAALGGADGGASSAVMMRELQGAIIVAGGVEVLIGYLGVFGRLKKYMGPLVISVVITLIGLALIGVPQITSADQNWYLAGLTLALITLFSQYLDTAHPAFKLFPVLLGVIVSYVVAAGLSVAGVIAPGAAGYVNLQTVIEAPALMPIYPLQWGFAGGAGTTTVALPVVGSVAFGIPQFTTSFIIGMLAGVAASMVESFGDYHAVARLSGVGAPSERRINHGIGMEGAMNVFSAVMGGSGSTSYSENIGAIGLTGVASRYVVQIGAAVMLVMGFVGYFGQLIATIPDPIVGGLYVAMFGQIVAVGLSNLKYVDLDSSRNVFIVGVAMFAGLAVPAYMGNVGSAAAFREGMRQVALVGPVLGTQLVADTVFVIGSTGMAVGGLIAFFFDNTIAGTRAERGLEEWEDTVEDDSDFESALDRFRGDESATAD